MLIESIDEQGRTSLKPMLLETQNSNNNNSSSKFKFKRKSDLKAPEEALRNKSIISVKHDNTYEIKYPTTSNI